MPPQWRRRGWILAGLEPIEPPITRVVQCVDEVSWVNGMNEHQRYSVATVARSPFSRPFEPRTAWAWAAWAGGTLRAASISTPTRAAPRWAIPSVSFASYQHAIGIHGHIAGIPLPYHLPRSGTLADRRLCLADWRGTDHPHPSRDLCGTVLSWSVGGDGDKGDAAGRSIAGHQHDAISRSY